MSNPAVEFCAYTIPHPSELFAHLKIQTDDTMTPVQALMKGIDDLSKLTTICLDTFNSSLEKKDFPIEEGVTIEPFENE